MSVLNRRASSSDGSFLAGYDPLHDTVSLFLVQALLIIAVARTFNVGLEVDPQLFVRNVKKSVAVSLAGIIVPFGATIGAAALLYSNYSESVRKLLGTNIGQATLAIGAVDDVIAWSFLVFVIAFVNNPGNPLVALYIFLVIVAYAIFLWYLVRPYLVHWVEISHNSDSVSQILVFAVLAMVLVSGFFTQALGAHAIFGGFLVGVIVPHGHSFAINLFEKLEDMVNIVFLPIYFVHAGFHVRLDLLNDGTAWGLVFLFVAANVISPKIYTILVTAVLISIIASLPLVSLIFMKKKLAHPHASEELLSGEDKQDDMVVTALRLVRLSDRNSTVMIATDADSTLRSDPVISVFRTFGTLNNIAVSSLLAVANIEEFPDQIVSAAVDNEANLLLIPWQHAADLSSLVDENHMHSLVDAVQRDSPCTVAVFIDRGFGVLRGLSGKDSAGSTESLLSKPQRIFVPYFGGRDDREALQLAYHLTRGAAPSVQVSILRIFSSSPKSLGTANVSIQTLNEQADDFLDEMISDLGALRAKLQRNEEPGSIAAIIAKAGEVANSEGDLIILGASAYSNNALKLWVDRETVASVITVQGHSERALSH
ncbi:Sodium/hydrogen exchanger family-domain-containing protein [Chytridium lagenaria]|nr:Sodium/hydrogen exchanger family-domain-containing protein [Chytridium lagenaria]